MYDQDNKNGCCDWVRIFWYALFANKFATYLMSFHFGLVLRADNKVAVFREVRSRTTESVKWCNRDAKIHTIFEGTSEVQQLLIARAISGLRVE